jgi:regulatory protein
VAVVTKIQTQKQQGDRFNIYLDGEYSFSLLGLDLSLSGLREGQGLSEDEVAAWRSRSEEGKTYNVAIRFLSYRQRSCREVREYLERKEYATPVIESVVDRLLAAGLLDDAKFAQAWVADRMALRPRSRRMLMQELCQKGVSQDDIGSGLAELPDEEYALIIRRLVEKKRREVRYRDDQKLIQYLLRQGFGFADIKLALEGSE